MVRTISTAFVVLVMALSLQAQAVSDAAELTKLLKEFLDGAARSDAAVHDKFWADDLIYTGSAGRRRNKPDVMRDVRSARAPKPSDPKTSYAAEDIRIQQYGNMAVIAFRLVSTTEKDGLTRVANYLNSGTFVKRNGKWQVVSWQATAMPRTGEEVKKEVAAVEAAFHQALLASDVKRLELLTDESFIWTQRTGERQTRQQLLDILASGQLKYSKLDTNNVTINVYGDAAVVRGDSPQQRSSFIGAEGLGDPSPFIAFYTLTFVNKSGDWKAVAMHSGRP